MIHPEPTMERLAKLHRAVACPYCDAAAGAPCVGVRGGPVRYTHYDRRQDARRARQTHRKAG